MGLCQSNERVITQSKPVGHDENGSQQRKPTISDKIYNQDEIIKKLSYNKDDNLKIALLKLEIQENCKEIQLQKEIILEMKKKLQDLKTKKLSETSSEVIQEINLEINKQVQNLTEKTNQFQKQLMSSSSGSKLQQVIQEVPAETENIEDSLIQRVDQQLLQSNKKISQIQSLQENSFIALDDPAKLQKIEEDINNEEAEKKKQTKKTQKKPYQFEQQFVQEQLEEQKIDIQQEQKLKKSQQMIEYNQEPNEEEVNAAEQQQFEMKMNDIDNISDSDSESQQLETTDDDEDESFQAHRFVKNKGQMDSQFSNFAIHTIKHYLIMQQQLEAQFEAKEKRNNELLDLLEKNCLESIKVERQLSQVMKSAQRLDLERKKKNFSEEKDSIEEEIDQLLKEKIICLTQMEEYQKLIDMSNIDLVEKFKKVYQQFLYEIQEELVNYENQLDLVTSLEEKINERDDLYVVEEECNSEQDMDEYQRNQEDLLSPIRKPSQSYTENNDSDTESIMKNADYKHNNTCRNEFDLEILPLREIVEEFISDCKMRRLSVDEISEQKQKITGDIQNWLQKLTKVVADQKQKYDFHKNKLNQYIENHPNADENYLNKEENIKNFKNNVKINLKFQNINQEKFGNIEQIEMVNQEDNDEDQDFIRKFDEQLFPVNSKSKSTNNMQQQQKLKQKKQKKGAKKQSTAGQKKKNANNLQMKTTKVNQLTNQVNAMKKKKHRRAKKNQNQNAAQILTSNQA